MRSLVVSPRVLTVSKNEDRSACNRANEFLSLCEALSAIKVLKEIRLTVKSIRASTFFGLGNISNLQFFVTNLKLKLILVDCNLSPIQQRNLERELNAKVLDRTGLILEIFGDRAQTREGVLQVELAHLQYQKSRLVRSWTHLERQRGGIGFTAGPGEKQIESDRRALAEKISKIKKSLKNVMQMRSLHRKSRIKNNIPVVALIGYTNAGKSSIFNALTKANVVARDMLFATLDPTMRAMSVFGKKKIILSDTVGFISNLPTGLISAFKATLEEVVNADLILHVRDISDLDHKSQALEVQKILDELDWKGRPRPPIFELYNKIDRLTSEELDSLKLKCQKSNDPVLISATSALGFEFLENKIYKHFEKSSYKETIFLRFGESKKRAWLFSKNIVRQEFIYDDGFSLRVVWSDEQKNLFNKIVC